MFGAFKKRNSTFCIAFCILLTTSIYITNKLYFKKSIESSYVTNTPNKKSIYLTIDDGPCPVVTDAILDILNKNNIKATFFVVGKEIDGREDILNRIYKEGHSIGLHTYSHDFRKIYSSENTFIDEMLKTQDKVKKITGHTSTIIRFPGGSSGHLNKTYLENLHKHGFKIYDWNVNLGDGVNPNLSIKKLVDNSKQYKNDYSRIIILMHCNFNNKNTAKALPSIIDYYKDLGYEFKAISEDTKEYYYRLKN
ncbi:polysaccharide deacetylase family protein [Clostridium sp. MB40-C1]|uniref:polysaccharide deacetylase family protein n=1 Tax=Clostridium sp. MB40-C1 TaxID=3070996 RepID=UPI0027DFA6DB|nr:polysaccharide deacetylase family protein [Clostridium sp. MB40-C1]WMJ79723.1 polysaccharide deacetylase family protein [Clostridium sp. MB40-C1]